ncbi:DUF695 domain-containing protein [Rheinheimera mesophila]|uniref:DUF695 domain-containing protein n=1 Tax=Rheinheimera mesophila TaxID=1547515 RepID=A0A3P3QRR6_9GAMM|nr:DUF695 domain-containing protein [Rheinheimera mesophila]KKL01053.1 hypothetical protein SD53_11980 [Rheinheimera mesophila]RRJ23897.1 DUF695 domain-containing protein [Rheinheimera mesophila]
MEIPSSETAPWNLAEGDNNGLPRIIRYRPDLEPFIGIESHPQRLVIIWEYDTENSSGMPSDKQSDEMKAFEDVLASALDPNRLAVLAFILTSNGSREWHYYVSDIEEVGQKINNALSGFPKLPIHLQVESDPEWEQISIVYSICS